MAAFDHDAIRALLAAKVEEFGAEYVYPGSDPYDGEGCWYMEDGAPSCLVGQVFFDMGVSIEGLSDLDARLVVDGKPTPGLHNTKAANFYPLENRNIPLQEWLANKYGVEVSLEDLGLLGDVQYSQDRGVSWGEAVTEFDAEPED